MSEKKAEQKAPITDPFSTKLVGVSKKKVTKVFYDGALGLAVEVQEIYPGELLELENSSYKLSKAVDIEELRQSVEQGKKVNMNNLVQMDTPTFVLETKARRIARWNLTDDDDNDLPVSAENIGRIKDKRIYDKITLWIKEFDELNNAGELGN